MKKYIGKTWNTGKKRVAVLLTAVIFFSQWICVNAEELPTEKEEVVYAMLNADGSVDGVYVVNSFTDSSILDYGNYTDIRNLTTTDDIRMENGTIQVETQEDKLYYQGNLKTKEIPWNIEIHHYMDDEEFAAEEIAGKAGTWKMTMDITQNESCDERFWDGYALQISFSLDSVKCRNIEAENATIANVGSDKQISYIVLPKKGANLEITADVNDFEMSGIAINAMKLNLEMDFDSSELTDKLQEVKDAVKELDDGAAELDDGASKLKDGAGELYDGTVSLKDGASSLQDGVNELNSGISEMQEALNKLNENSSALKEGSSDLYDGLKTLQASLNNVQVDEQNLQNLVTSSAQIKSGIDSLVLGLQTMNTTIDGFYLQLNGELSSAGINGVTDLSTKCSNLVDYLYSANSISDEQYGLLTAATAYITNSNAVLQGMDAALDENGETMMAGALALQTSYAQFDMAITGLATSLISLADNMSALKAGVDTLTSGSRSLSNGVTEYTGAVSQIKNGFEKIYSGFLEVADGTSKLYVGTKDAVDGALELYNGSSDMKEGTGELMDGTSEFYKESMDMDSEMEETIDDTISDMMGKNVETISFVSEKNTQVKSVLFVIKTPAVEKEEAEVEMPEVEESLPFWQKFIKLFQKRVIRTE